LGGILIYKAKWYVVSLNGAIWYIRIYSISEGFNYRVYVDFAYTIYGFGCVHKYDIINGGYHPLCFIDEIISIREISLREVKDLGFII
jgi:hypothetical protein